MNRKISWSVAPLLLVILIGCAPKAITPIDRSLIYLDQYEALEATYKNQFRVASDKERKWMREKVAPILDDLRAAVIRYTQIAVIGHDDVHERTEIIQLYREASLALVREVME